MRFDTKKDVLLDKRHLIELFDVPLNTSEAAEFLRVCKKTVLKYVYKDGLKAHRLPSGELRFKKSDILRWLSKRDI